MIHRLHSRRHLIDLAAAAMRSSRRRSPIARSGTWGLADVYAMMADSASALWAYRAVLAIEPGGRVAREAVARIKSGG